jgi:hypothetical protein
MMAQVVVILEVVVFRDFLSTLSVQGQWLYKINVKNINNYMRSVE